jgi:metallo-beta-lactamase family protein
LLDAARLQEEDAEFKQRRHRKEDRTGPYPVVPLYTVEDAEACFPLFSPVKYKDTITLAGDIEVQMCDAGHVLGSAVIRFTAHNNGTPRSVLFSGDIGRPHRPIVRDPAEVHAADYILVESTYGDHVHHDREDIKKVLAEAINKTVQAGGNIIVPSFALERSQEVLYYINELLLEHAIGQLTVFLDSPMAAAITKVFEHHPELFDRDMTTHLRNHESPFKFPGLKITDTKSKSQAIKDIKESIMIISGSGMCTGGRVKHHLVNEISRAESTVLFVGYQASGTLGRLLVDGEPEVRILGQTYPVKARIVQVHGFSAHADKQELLAWLQAVERPPKKVFVVHGEPDSALHFVDFLKEKTGWDVMAPAYQDVVNLD